MADPTGGFDFDPTAIDEWLMNNGGLDNDFVFDPTLADTSADDLFLPEPLADPTQMFPVAGETDKMPELPQIQVPPQQPQPQAQQTLAPDTSLGPSWDPRIGYYFPVLDGSRVSTPMSAVPPSKVMLTASAPPKPSNKRKYGPAAYLEEQARARAEGHSLPRNVSLSKATYTGKPASKHPLRTSKKSNIVQVCVCNDKEQNKIKRPKNAFILYRSANSQNIIRKQGTFNNQDVSRTAAYQWHNETEEVRQHFMNLAEEEKQRHMIKYPDYKYQPGASERNKFGSVSCRCGAYRANMAAMRGKFETDDADESEVDEYVPPPRRNTRAASQAQVIPVPARSYAPIPDASAFGFHTPAHQGEAAAYAANLKRKREGEQAQTTFQESNEEPLAKRRSSRVGKKSVSYVEPDENDIYFYTPEYTPGDATGLVGYVAADYVAPVSSPQATINPSDLQMLQKAIGDDVQQVPDMPAFNTRGRANSVKSKTPSPAVPQQEFDFNFDFDAFTGDADWNQVFAAQESMGDNIIVANRRASNTNQTDDAPAMRTRSRSKSAELESPKEANNPGLRRSSRRSK